MSEKERVQEEIELIIRDIINVARNEELTSEERYLMLNVLYETLKRLYKKLEGVEYE